MNSSTQYVVFGMYRSSIQHIKIIQALFPLHPSFFAFHTGGRCKGIFYFHGSHEQFHIGYCVWNASLLHPAHKDFIGIILSSILAFLHFILVSIAGIFYFHGIHEQFHIGCCVWNVSLLHLPCKIFIDIILSPILAFLDFILVSIFHFHGSHKQFDMGYTIIKCVLCFQYLHQPKLIAFTHSKKYVIKLSHC